jgi:hypothetical protein
MFGELRFLGQPSDDLGKKPPDVEHRTDTMILDIEVGRDDLGLRRIPEDAEDGDAEAGDPAGDLKDIQDGLGFTSENVPTLIAHPALLPHRVTPRPFLHVVPDPAYQQPPEGSHRH